MTLLYFADTRFPIERANGVQTMATCHALAGRGHEVRLVVRPDTHDPARDPFAFYGLAPSARLTIEAVPAGAGATARRVRFLASALTRATGSTADVVLTRDLGLAALLVRLPPSRRPPLVYESHGLAPVVSEQMPHLLGRPGIQAGRAKLNRLEARERRVWRLAEGYVTITRTLADDLTVRYGPRERVFVVPDGAAPPAKAARVERSPEPIAAYAGHLYPWKGVDVFVDALALAPGIRGLVVGGHPGEADLARVQALVAARGLAARVEITGLVPPPDVARHLARADILVLPNTATAVSERYTSPLKLFEYLHLGRPIIASDLPAIREILTDDRTALFVPPGDAAALARALLRVAGDRGLADRLGREAASIAGEYTWTHRAGRLEAALSDVRAAVRR